MKTVIQWATRNAPAMNTLMLATLVMGTAGMMLMRREVFPEFNLDIVLVSVPYPGASPEEVEEGICQKLEEAVRSVDGIKRETSVAEENIGFMILELETGANVQKVLNEVRSEIDAIASFPELAEEPEMKELTLRMPAIRVGVIGEETNDPDSDRRLREVAERVREELVLLPAVSQANILGAPPYQIDVEVPESQLRRHNLTLKQIADTIRRQNIEMPGGTMRTPGQDVLLRGKNRREVGAEIAALPVLEDPGGDVITVDDLGHVRDGFEDRYFSCRINGRPGLIVSVERTNSEDLLAMARAVRDFVECADYPGYELRYWEDRSLDVEDRMDMLIGNGLQGLVLVFLVLAIFLNLRLAFWVSLGIPVSVLGAGAVLYATGQTLNMLSMFAFLMALGIVVDDAIVIGENIYRHREMNKKTARAAVDGTYEVLPSVLASVTTTIIAFLPLMFVAGVMGKFLAILPVTVITMLVISLIEALLILPCHLAHADSWIFRFFHVVLFPFRALADLAYRLNQLSARLLDFLIRRTYRPTLDWAMRWPAVTLSLALFALLVVAGFIRAGVIPFVAFPKLDTRVVESRITFAEGTPGAVTDRATQRIEQALLDVAGQHGDDLVLTRYRMAGAATSTDNAASVGSSFDGGHMGIVSVELVPPEERELHSTRLIELWRRRWEERYAAEFSGVETITFSGEGVGPGGRPIEFKLLSPANDEDFARLEEAVELCKAELANYDGIIDIEDDSRPGKWEYQIRVKDTAKALGVTVADLAETVRASYYGEEVMRLQRGRHEVKLMVRYPPEQRRSLADFQEIRVRTRDGSERPITELAEVQVSRGYSELNRRSQRRAITISGDVQGRANASKVVADFRNGFLKELLEQEEFRNIRVLWEGQQEMTRDSIRSLLLGLVAALLAMFALLTLEFRSYLQPLLILAIVPFGFIGAALGHMLMGLEFTMLSLFGMIALTGVVVNDSIVLIDFINHRLEDGMPLREALLEAGTRRFRPVVLTSITTVAALTPMLLETSFQGQLLVPMANSLAFGLLVATALILVLVPTMYSIYYRLIGGNLDKLDKDEDAAEHAHLTWVDAADVPEGSSVQAAVHSASTIHGQTGERREESAVS